MLDARDSPVITALEYVREYQEMVKREICFSCGQKGHNKRSCIGPNNVAASEARSGPQIPRQKKASTSQAAIRSQPPRQSQRSASGSRAPRQSQREQATGHSSLSGSQRKTKKTTARMTPTK
nr:hypothetical protein [Tanacetum cinerariifolium]